MDLGVEGAEYVLDVFGVGSGSFSAGELRIVAYTDNAFHEGNNTISLHCRLTL